MLFNIQSYSPPRSRAHRYDSNLEKHASKVIFDAIIFVLVLRMSSIIDQERLSSGNAIIIAGRDNTLPTMYLSKIPHPLWKHKGKAYFFVKSTTSNTLKYPVNKDKDHTGMFLQ